MTRVEIIITKCIFVRACISVCLITFVPFVFFFRFNTIKTWVVSLYILSRGHRLKFHVAEYCIYFSEDQAV